MSTLALPLWLALAGIVLRGAGFAYRKELSRLSLQRAAGATFAFSSLVTPVLHGHRGRRHRHRRRGRRREPGEPSGLDQPDGAQVAAVVAGALSLAALFELQNSNRLLFDRLTGRALPLVVVSGFADWRSSSCWPSAGRKAPRSSRCSASPPWSGAGGLPSTRCCCPAPRVHVGPAVRTAALSAVTIAAVIRRLRQR
jgi:hypothetical protein